MSAGLGYIHLGGHAAVEPALGQIQLTFEILDGGVEQLDLRIQAAQLEIVGGHGRLQAQVHAGHVSRTGLRVLVGRLHRAADASPEIGLPASPSSEDQIVVIADRGGGDQWAVG